MKVRLIIFAIIGAIVLVSFFLLVRLKTTQKKSETVVVLMKPNAFEPKTIILKKGTTVVFINEDTQDRWPASDPHPEHYIYGGFDPRQSIQTGKEWSFVFDNVGDWTYHDHLFEAIRGKIKIE